MLRFCIWTSIFFILIFAGVQKALAQGLEFSSNDSLINKRTSYNVFELESPKFKDQLTLKFDLSLWDVEHFGYILNITDKQQNSYSLTYMHSGNQANLYFNIDGKTSKLKIPLRKELLVKSKFLKLQLRMDLKHDLVIIDVNDKQYNALGFGFNPEIAPKIMFGKNDHYTDVPKMAIRNLSISDKSKVYAFPLNEWRGNQVYSKEGDPIGSVKNPHWLINESYTWAPVFDIKFNKPAGVNFNPIRNEVITYTADSLIRYNVISNTSSSAHYSTSMPLKLFLGKSLMNTRENSLYAYELNPQNSTHVTIAGLNLQDLSWKVVGHASLKQPRHHHNSFYNQKEDELYVFGGYGGYAYHNEFFKYDKKTDRWDQTSFLGDDITPRFFSADGPSTVPNEVYIFSGYGNQSGNQVVGAVHYYDLYRVNLTTHRITKCWEIKPTEKGFVPANNLILSADGKYFYVLCYPHEDAKTILKLYRFSVVNGKYEVVSGKIPVASERIESDINLFFDKSSKQFICTVQEFTSPEHSTLKGFTLAYPPINEQMYHQGLNKVYSKRSSYLMIGLSLAIFAITGLVYFFRRKRSALIAQKQLPQVSTSIAPEQSFRLVKPGPVRSALKDLNPIEKANSIYLLEEFSVYDSKARNITHLFSPKIQQLFVFILLNSKDGKGVSSKRISAHLWPEKELSKTKNIKGVTINHLRSILRDIDGIELEFTNDHYLFTFDERVFCDYFTIESFLKYGEAPEKVIADYIPIMLHGSLLPAMQDPWIDKFKNAFEQTIIEKLLPEMNAAFECEDYKLSQDLARVILKVDPFNDQAIKLLLYAMRRLKGREAAVRYFQQFREEYFVSLGINYPLSFEQLCP
ncbi:MAG: hypothetical protein JWQ28_403 [Pedobacter sp.]|nr:hypothetical protein [Pedobacter sp.]